MVETTTSALGECAYCGKKVDCGSLFCSHGCKDNFDRRKQMMSEMKPNLSYCSCPSCGKDMGKTYDEDEKDLPACPICGTPLKFSQNKKHEEIKKMAWEMQIAFAINPPSLHGKKVTDTEKCQAIAWENAERFYNYAKEKQEEGDE